MEHLRPLTRLEFLSLFSTRVTDQGLELPVGRSSLRKLYLNGTKVTEAGVKKLAAALPRCRIEWDGGVIEPTEKRGDSLPRRDSLSREGRPLLNRDSPRLTARMLFQKAVNLGKPSGSHHGENGRSYPESQVK